jgi:hypothetical protein
LGIYQVAKNCRTSVEMIEKHYAAHLKDMIDTSLINVRKDRTPAKEPAKELDGDLADEADETPEPNKPKAKPKPKK